ncbi:MAG: hypothetical protein DME18_14395 [Verrucomicrobia bacterium]|nr:MAG: hypothetical protein DME18_14395 [Verrucomicrobiota bacterium]
MHSQLISPLVLTVLVCASTVQRGGETLPASDQRLVAAKDLNTPRAFPKIESKTEWEARAKETRGHSVILFDAFLTGAQANAQPAPARKRLDLFFSAYNRTDLQERVQDCITACAFAQAHSKSRRVVLCGSGRAGLWALLAAPAADAVVADCDSLDLTNDELLLRPDLFVPGLRKIGAFDGAAALAAPHPLLLHNAGGNFPTGLLHAAYAAAKAEKAFRAEPARLPDQAIADWLER